ncbi:DUF6879 family protein [Microbispora sp. NPDC088329]|uniref:DUF6879 family protein n=1 Tax=Microbispora sp. NPDC088329 TaxID=3154869 RepID=UPI0034178033
MYPPQWVTKAGERLDLEEFGERFAAAWSSLERRFLKVECWQSYHEPGRNRSQEAYYRGDADQAVNLLRKEAEADKPLYDDIRERGIEYARIRLVQEPLTIYLRYEMLAYRIRAEMGENIEVVPCDPVRSLPDDELFDFLLFDRCTALVHDYGDIGLQAGGWLLHDDEALSRLERTAIELRQVAMPFEHFSSRL